MNCEKIKLKEDVNLNLIKTDKFKTNLVSIFLTKRLDKENVTKEALIPAILRLGTNKIKTQKDLNEKFENMYGAEFNCGIEKRGDNHILKFYIETIDDSFTLNKENVLEESIKLLLDIVFNPLVEKNSFNKSYVLNEKEHLKKIIESKIDNKSTYAYLRCIEEMYKNEIFGIYEYGCIDDLKKIDEKNLYEYYKEFINECKIDIYISGRLENKESIINSVTKNEQISGLKDRKALYVPNSIEKVSTTIKEKEIEEKMDITQGKIVIGLNVINSDDEASILNVYNAILGGGANSKLFQNVRERASLAYTASSIYIKAKNVIFIRCGIEIDNYEKTIKIIKEQLEDIKNGKFSQKDIDDAKELIISSLNSISDEQANEITYELSQELSDKKVTINEFIEEIKNVTKAQIESASKKVQINTIYFLRN